MEILDIKSDDMQYDILNFLSLFLYTIERHVPLPKDIKFITREELLDPSENDSAILQTKESLNKDRLEQIFEANREICFGFGKGYKKHEFNLINR